MIKRIDTLESLVGLLAWTIVTSFVVALLAVGQDVFAPLVVAVFLWLVVNALVDVFGRTPGLRLLPTWAHFALSQIATLGAIGLVFIFVGDAITQMANDVPVLKERLVKAIAQIEQTIGFEIAPALQNMRQQIDAGSILTAMVSTVASFAGMFGLVLVYTLFLFLEQRVFRRKISALFPDQEKAKSTTEILARVTDVLSRYVATKFSVAAIIGLSAFVILTTSGIEHAAFWAFLIFLLDFIPTIGSLTAIVLTTLAALAHYGAVEPALVVGAALAAVQIAMANFVEPRWMGSTLNLSPLAVILSLAVWGTIWGTIGLFLAVPLTAATAIILAEFASTRPLAIAISLTGGLQPEG